MPELFMPTPVAPPQHPPRSSLTQSQLPLPQPVPIITTAANGITTTRRMSTSEPRKKRHGSSSHQPRRRAAWKKLLWVKQDYPDNWVDPTFLKDLQRNINVHPYDFYSLVAESTVVVQHLASAVIFVTSFVAIYIEIVSPVSVVAVSTVLTIAGWAVWDRAVTSRDDLAAGGGGGGGGGSATALNHKGLGLDFSSEQRSSFNSGSYFPPFDSAVYPSSSPTTPRPPTPPPPPAYQPANTSLRKSRIISTFKSALLIYFTLLGLSPILRSLTKGVTSDSIWAIATWLFMANFLSFDYSSSVERNFPASFSTNAAITSSVVLASRLTDTSHVFSLMLFSIQVFGLFPVFRRTLKHISWNWHVALTVVLVLGAAAGLWFVAGWGWALAWVLGVIAGMGGCGWWMIDLQKYKNEIHGPWDPARPVIRRQWA
ncbi:phosphatidylinositol:UDP-GlcNAc transferase PIG-C [Tricharina praecox]|uniref:phosphatidylinositol:UDP-GlcNAc transferase PIG-C n=1 Tax=Tricharina praecox TaxID=43433 RepID=UPI00221EA47A|nr:phosphatidylinositol:UDP-GlcNAc transferase PIG-C [Tricharina praecox]KAI5844721.1 phosphatidylinositol:UDP-GlcNAc transferase PIG-C [Tricharina praecox]